VTTLSSVLANVIGPMLLVGAVGVALGRTRAVDARTLASLAVAVLTPSLAFYALATSAVSHETLVRTAGYVVVQYAVLGGLTWAIGRVAGWDRTLVTGLALATMFSNGGNAGLPIALFAWGTPGFHAALGFFAIQAIATNVLAAFIAARAGHDARRAIRAVLRLPVTYAIAAGLAVNLLGITLPVTVVKAAQFLANGSVAMLLLLVGVEISTARIEHAHLHHLAFATVTRLLVAPVVAWTTAPLFGLEGLARQTSILQASMPTAVNAAVWALQFGVVPGLVSSVVAVTTLLSVLTITPLLVLLR